MIESDGTLGNEEIVDRDESRLIDIDGTLENGFTFTLDGKALVMKYSDRIVEVRIKPVREVGSISGMLVIEGGTSIKICDDESFIDEDSETSCDIEEAGEGDKYGKSESVGVTIDTDERSKDKCES